MRIGVAQLACAQSSMQKRKFLSTFNLLTTTVFSELASVAVHRLMRRRPYTPAQPLTQGPAATAPLKTQPHEHKHQSCEALSIGARVTERRLSNWSLVHSTHWFPSHSHLQQSNDKRAICDLYMSRLLAMDLILGVSVRRPLPPFAPNWRTT